MQYYYSAHPFWAKMAPTVASLLQRELCSVCHFLLVARDKSLTLTLLIFMFMVIVFLAIFYAFVFLNLGIEGFHIVNLKKRINTA